MQAYRQHIRNVEQKRYLPLRLWARLLDYLLIKILLSLTLTLFGTESGAWEALGFYLLYNLLCALFAEGKTVGKALCGLRVLFEDSAPKTGLFREMCLWACFPLIILALPFNRERRSLHERLSRSAITHVSG